VKLAKSNEEAIGELINIEVFYWADSMVALYWINGEWYQWKTWVANRCRPIQETTSRGAWRHIAGKENPADLCSRGVSASKLVEEDSIWWHGRQMLHEPQEQWTHEPLDKSVIERKDVSIEYKSSTAITLAATTVTFPPTIFNVRRYGTLETV
jgi:hypothetical protein